jgi:hypothetical protein
VHVDEDINPNMPNINISQFNEKLSSSTARETPLLV